MQTIAISNLIIDPHAWEKWSRYNYLSNGNCREPKMRVPILTKLRDVAMWIWPSPALHKEVHNGRPGG
jgi:hypothetical protein